MLTYVESVGYIVVFCGSPYFAVSGERKLMNVIFDADNDEFWSWTTLNRFRLLLVSGALKMTDMKLTDMKMQDMFQVSE